VVLVTHDEALRPVPRVQLKDGVSWLKHALSDAPLRRGCAPATLLILALAIAVAVPRRCGELFTARVRAGPAQAGDCSPGLAVIGRTPLRRTWAGSRRGART